MGWFDDVDYKRILLAFDKVYYLLPKRLVEFRNQAGVKRSLFFPLSLHESNAFTITHFVPEESQLQLVLAAASADSKNDQFSAIVGSIPPKERLYTWSVVNADGDLSAGGTSPALPESATVQAHALLLNKFCLAADDADCVPITGKSYIHHLLSEKLRSGLNEMRAKAPQVLPPIIRDREITYGPVVGRLIQALVSDSELAARSFDEILAFKSSNYALFQRFSYTVRQMVSKVRSLPGDVNFSSDIQELMATDVWAELGDTQADLRSAWSKMFKSGAKELIRELVTPKSIKLAGAISIGMLPVSLQGLTIASALSAAAPVAGWALAELIDLLERRKDLERRGLYYLVKFAG